MSDHLIAEANRHARALTIERDQILTELALLREWQREVIQNANAHHAERKDAIARAESAEREVERLKSDGAASAFVDMACRASRAETDRNNLRADLDAIKAILTEQKARAERAEAELATERARLDSGQILLTVAGERVWHSGVDLRAAIDAAMKEGSK